MAPSQKKNRLQGGDTMESNVLVKLENHDGRIGRLEHRVKELEANQKEIRDLTYSVHTLALNVEKMVDEQKSQSERITRIEDEPGEKWNTMQKTLLTSVVSTVAGILVTAIIALIYLSMKGAI